MNLPKLLPKLKRPWGAALLSSQQVPVLRAVMVSVSELWHSSSWLQGRPSHPQHVPHCCPLFWAAQAQMGMGVGTNTPWPCWGMCPSSAQVCLQGTMYKFINCKTIAQLYSACAMAAEQVSLAKTVTLPSTASLCSLNKHDENANHKFISAWLCLVFFLSHNQNMVVEFIVGAVLASCCKMQNWEKVEYCDKKAETKHMSVIQAPPHVVSQSG